MPLRRAVIDLDINDDRLKAVVELMNKYRAGVAYMPGAWGNVNKAEDASRGLLRDIRDLMVVQIAALGQVESAAKKVTTTIDRTKFSMASLARSTKDFANELSRATSTILKWTGITGVIGSLAGLLSAEGIAHLARSGAGAFSQTGGYAGPTTYGQVSAARVFGSIIPPGDLLGRLTDMLTTSTSRAGLQAVGIDVGALGPNTSAGNLVVPFLRGLRHLAQTTDPRFLGDYLNAVPGLQGLTPQALRLGKMSDKQFEELARVYAKNLDELNKVTQPMLFNLTKLDAQFALAATKIETGFLVALDKIAPAVGKFVDITSTKIKEFLEAPVIGKMLKELNDSLENLNINDFLEGVKQAGINALKFAHDVGVAAGGIEAFIKWVNDLPSHVPGWSGYIDPRDRPENKPVSPNNPPPFSWWNPGSWLWHQREPAASSPLPGKQSYTGMGRAGAYTSTIVGTARAAGASDAAIQGMLAGALGEGGTGNNWKAGDHGTSFGHWQLHEGGELNRYLAEGNKPGDTEAQTRYVLKRLNEIHPGFSQITDPRLASRVVSQFEKSVQGPQYYANFLTAAAHEILGIKTASAGQGLRGAPGVKFNSRGGAYSSELDTMGAEEQAKVAASMAAIKGAMRSGKSWYREQEQDVSVVKPSGVRVTVEHATGASPAIAGSQM